MKRGWRLGVWDAVWLASLTVSPLACSGKSVETGDATSTGGGAGTAGAPNNGGGGSTAAGASNGGGTAGTAGVSGSAGQAGAGTSPPVNRFPCESTVPVGTGIENCGTYRRRIGAVNCMPSCADSCAFRCLSDSDCTGKQGCDCTSFATQCVALGCTSNADCAAGFNCASYSTDGCQTVGYACQLPSDECGGNADCTGGLVCVYTPSGRQCQPGGCLL